MERFSILEEKIRSVVRKVLREGFLDDVYSGNNFMKWFKGSKIVDENGKPLILGHATRSFGFKKFNTEFIHLSSIDDASYFSCGNKRLFRYKNTLSKLSDDDVIELYNKYLGYKSDGRYFKLDSNALARIEDAYRNEFVKIEKWLKDGEDFAEEDLNNLKHAYSLFIGKVNRFPNKLIYKGNYWEDTLPPLMPKGFGIDNESFKIWINSYFITSNRLRKVVLNWMFENDNYMGKGGTYPLCARVLNPLYVDCKGNPWDRIYVTPYGCNGYNELFDKYCELGLNKTDLKKGSDFGLDNESIAYLAKLCGYDGVVFKNIREGAYGNVKMDTTYIVFSTKQLKSPYENNGNFGDVDNMFK